jgi:hypothetical protein
MSTLGQNAVSTLVSAGADAMNNLFEFRFIPPGSIGVDTNDLRIRAQGFTPPNPTIQAYAVNWRTVSIERPSAKINLTRNFTVTFRIDANYRVFKVLEAWRGLTSISSTGYVNTDTFNNTGGIEVVALDRIVNNTTMGDDTTLSSIMQNSEMKWLFQDVWIGSIQLANYGTEASAAQTATVTFHYGNYLDPQGVLFGVRE